jgi:transcriptional regulator with XRE-family HTH domain
MLERMSLRALARAVQASAAHLSDIERHRRRPSTALLRRIARALEADYSGLARLDLRTDAGTRRWVAETPTVQPLLRRLRSQPDELLPLVVQVIEEVLDVCDVESVFRATRERGLRAGRKILRRVRGPGSPVGVRGELEKDPAQRLLRRALDEHGNVVGQLPDRRVRTRKNEGRTAGNKKTPSSK